MTYARTGAERPDPDPTQGHRTGDDARLEGAGKPDHLDGHRLLRLCSRVFGCTWTCEMSSRLPEARERRAA